ncbi:MAG: hypothetical protein K1X51_17770, partial [Rhodospirillaceae bacterium]|nr:hypothetical protein [Rhodospirillaceae bacterium]
MRALLLTRYGGADATELREGVPEPSVRRGADSFPATKAELADGRLTLAAAGASVSAVLRVATRPSYVRLAVESVAGPAIDALTFLDVPLTLAGTPAEAFGACAYSLNLFTRVDALPAL